MDEKNEQLVTLQNPGLGLLPQRWFSRFYYPQLPDAPPVPDLGAIEIDPATIQDIIPGKDRVIFPLPSGEVILAIANTRITSPIPKNTRTAPIPRIHGHALRFCGCAMGIGDQAGGGVGGGVSDGVAPG